MTDFHSKNAVYALHGKYYGLQVYLILCDSQFKQYVHYKH